MTGFGVVRPLPGIAESVRINTAITLPLGVEAYAAFALRAWLSASMAVSARTRRYARWSAIGSLVLGMAGQVAYHLLTQSRTTRAPWGVTTLVSCLPVLVLGMGTALAHLLRADADDLAEDQPRDDADRPARKLRSCSRTKCAWSRAPGPGRFRMPAVTGRAMADPIRAGTGSTRRDRILVLGRTCAVTRCLAGAGPGQADQS
jgi:hypothetical protein